MIADHFIYRREGWFLPFITALVLYFSSCSNDLPEYVSEKELSAADKTKMQEDALKELFSAGNSFSDSLLPFTREYIENFYSNRDFALFWWNGSDTLHRASLLCGVLDSAWAFGLDPEWYLLSQIRTYIDSAKNTDNYVETAINSARSDILLTNSYFRLIADLSVGFIDTASMHITWRKDSLPFRPDEYLTSSTDTDFVTKIFAHQPQITEYKLLQQALSRWWRSNELWDDTLEIADYKKDSLGFMNDAKKVLIRMNFLDTTTAKNDSLVIAALKKFQELHAIDVDGKPGKQSLASLKKSNYYRFLQSALALEKLRWKKRSSEFQLYANIPSYTLTVFRNDSALHYFRLVTGAPDHQTPEFRAKVKYITLHPYWHLPHSISTKEFLPLARRDTNYVLKNNYRVFDLNKNIVSLSSINWSKLSTDYFPYRVRQEGGPGNSLGLIVFYFPNKYDVYMHDTPAKYLFSRSVRAFSHGCMRLQDPFRLGEIILKEEKQKDTLTADSLKYRALMGAEQRINLKKHILIEIDYITVTANDSGQIFFHLDIYGRDEKYIEIISGRKNKSPVL